MSYLPIGKDTGQHNVQGNPDMELREQDRWLPIANVARLMKNTLPTTAKVSKDAKECMQECVSEFISFITSEASDKCLREKRKTINGEDILYSLHDLGFENYAEVLKIYLAKYREQQALKQERGESRPLKKKKREAVDQNQDEDFIKGEDDALLQSQLAYLELPHVKDVNSPDYFQEYENNENVPQMREPMKDLDVVMDKEDYRYDYLSEEGMKKNMDLGKLGDDADIDNLTTGITNRSYY